jgi:phosphoribosylglycinamide formyltransferase-1
LLRVGMLVFGYQVILLVYGALLGQWAFFWKYEKKLLGKLGILKTEGLQNQESGTRIAIFASGAGSNAARIIGYLEGHTTIKVALVVCNKPEAGVLHIAATHQVPVLLIEKERFFRGDTYLPELKKHGIDFIVLAGFLWKVPAELVAAYPDHIINIHPALLPKYGGKGMYGMKVHEAVIAAGEKESGITIHYVNDHFDEGEHIFQAKTIIEAGDTPESLAQKIHELEHVHFPETIKKLLTK